MAQAAKNRRGGRRAHRRSAKCCLAKTPSPELVLKRGVDLYFRAVLGDELASGHNEARSQIFRGIELQAPWALLGVKRAFVPAVDFVVDHFGQ
jgi:hypothetical protein